MKLIINGESFETSKSGSVLELLQELGIEPAGVAVEVNVSIIRKADYAAFRLKEDDTVEIVNFVGGG